MSLWSSRILRALGALVFLGICAAPAHAQYPAGFEKLCPPNTPAYAPLASLTTTDQNAGGLQRANGCYDSNGKLLLQPDSTTGGLPWYVVTNPPFNAKCDGMTDDSTAFAAAIAAQEANKGGIVYVPNGPMPCVISLNVFANHVAATTDSWLYVWLDNSLLINGGTISGSQEIAFVGRAGAQAGFLGFFTAANSVSWTPTSSGISALAIRNSEAITFESISFAPSATGTMSVPTVKNLETTSMGSALFSFSNTTIQGNNCLGGVPAAQFDSGTAGAGNFGLSMTGIVLDCNGGVILDLHSFGIVRVGGPYNNFFSGTVKIDATSAPSANLASFTFSNIITENLNNQDFIDFEGGSGENINGVEVANIIFADFTGSVYLFKDNVENLGGFHYASPPTNSITGIRDPASSFSNMTDFSCTGDDNCSDAAVGGPNFGALGGQFRQATWGRPGTGARNEIVNNDPSGYAAVLRGRGSAALIEDGDGSPVASLGGPGIFANSVNPVPNGTIVTTFIGGDLDGSGGGGFHPTIAVPAGARIVVSSVTTSCGGGCVTGVTDSGGNVYTFAANQTFGGQQMTFAQACATSPLKTTDLIQYTGPTGANRVYGWIVEGGGCPSNVDAPSVMTGSAGPGGAVSFPSTTTFGYVEEVFQVLDTNQNTSYTASGGWTVDRGGTTDFFATQHQVFATPGTITPTITFNTAGTSSSSLYVGILIGPSLGSSSAPWPSAYSRVNVGSLYQTATNCSSSASPAVCAAAAAGSVAVPTGATPTLVIDTSAVTANSQILLTIDESLGTKLSVTCNTSLSTLVQPVVTARTAGVSFTIQINATLAVNPACVSYMVLN